jgi:hypothetical protein
MDEIELSQLIMQYPHIKAWETGVAIMLPVASNPMGQWTSSAILATFITKHAEMYRHFSSVVNGDDEIETEEDDEEDEDPSDGHFTTDANIALSEEKTNSFESWWRRLRIPKIFIGHYLEGQLPKISIGQIDTADLSTESLKDATEKNNIGPVEALMRMIEADPVETNVMDVFRLLTRSADLGSKNDECETEYVPLLITVAEELNVANPSIAFFQQSLLQLESLRYCFDYLLSFEKSDLLVPALLVTLPRRFPLPSRHVTILVDQDCDIPTMAEQVITQMSEYNKLSLLKSRTTFLFQGSEAVGPAIRTDVLTRIVPHLFGEIFEPTDERGIFLKPKSTVEDKSLFRSLGRLIGLCIKYKVPILGGRLSPSVVQILRFPLVEVGMAELVAILEEEDNDKARSVKTMIEMSEIDLLDSMSITRDQLLLTTRESVFGSIREDTLLLVKGIYDVIPFGFFSWFSQQEVTDMFNPKRGIDKQGLVDAITLPPEGSVDSLDIFEETKDTVAEEQIIEWLKSIIDSFDDEDLGMFVQFVSGSPLEPILGFRRMTGQPWLKITIDPYKRNQLPKAKVCFTELVLSLYDSEETMKEQLLYSIRNCGSIDLK